MNRWFGTNLDWVLPFEAEARRAYAGRLSSKLMVDVFAVEPLLTQRLVYRVGDVDANGLVPRTTLLVVFSPVQEFHGIPPQDWPHVYCTGPAPRLDQVGPDAFHRHGDGALCLWDPGDLPERQWTSELGLANLLVLAERHLVLEHTAALTGVWAADAAEHSSWNAALRRRYHQRLATAS